jgi:hypothetical protein
MIVRYLKSLVSDWSKGWLTIQGDELGTNQAGDPTTDGSMQGAPVILPLGLISRPMDPDVGPDGRPVAGAGVLTFEDEGGDVFSMPTTDQRAVKLVPPVKKGGTALHATGKHGGCINLDGDNGALMILIPNADASKNYVISIDPAGDSIQVRHASGMAMTMTGGGKNSVVVSNKAGNVYHEINDSGIVQNGNVTTNGGMVVGDVTKAVQMAMSTELIAVVAAFNAALAAGLPVAGGVAKLAAPVIVQTPGSQMLSASAFPPPPTP